jgi:anthranilate/para-aminobenzoate synthase component I
LAHARPLVIDWSRTPVILTHEATRRSAVLPEAVAPLGLLGALADRPWAVLVRRGGRTVVAADPVETAIGSEAWGALDRPPEPGAGDLAMAGGWIGLLSYDLAGTIERLPSPRPDPGGPPLAALGRYDTVALIEDDGRCTLATTGPTSRLHDLARAAGRAGPPRAPVRGGRVATSLPPRAYRDAVGAARELIAAGDCYQVNLAQRLTAAWPAPALALAGPLWAAAGPASGAAYLSLPGGAVVSASPERLVRVRDGVAATEPIKGTAPPGAAGALRASAKDRAEHVMIVDLARNDLGRVAVPGGVWVERLMAPLHTPYAEHLVSEVRAELAPGVTPAGVLRALFPGGSVTGAPKVRAMEVIRELEPVSRGPAFGSVVAVGADGSVDASIAIRTAWVGGGEARYWCGGAVTWDSDPEAERLEAWAKAAPFLAAVSR